MLLLGRLTIKNTAKIVSKAFMGKFDYVPRPPVPLFSFHKPYILVDVAILL